MRIVLHEFGKSISVTAEPYGLTVSSSLPIIWGQPETWPSEARDVSAGRRTAFEVASLLEMGLANVADGVVSIPYDSFPEVEAEDFRITTAFTKPSPFILKIDRSSDVGRPDFKYRYQYLLGATQVSLERVGFYVRRSATHEIFRLDERMYALVEAMDKFNCLSPEEKGPQRSWLDFANIKRWSREV